jgi:peptidyl-prolyl cis-trans isomerase B (cyclophilin B)|tara:strand:+ start:172 stop:624 length:453 start_codon:yes stop_codon:yes gene_type:complete
MNTKYTATFKMDKGDITFRLYDETPINTGNFIIKAEAGNYDGQSFDRVIPGFMVQLGPKEQEGGHPYLYDELETPRRKKNNNFHAYGVLSAANTGSPHTSMGAFFICLSRRGTQHLDPGHTTFGHVIDGMELIEQIAEGDTVNNIIISLT